MIITDTSSPGNIYFYQNSTSINTFATHCNKSVSSILFDEYYHMIVLCYSPSNFYIYHSNGTYTGTSGIACSSTPYYINFDTMNRLSGGYKFILLN